MAIDFGATSGVKIVPSTLPTEGSFEGQLLYRQSNNSWYYWNGSAWSVFGTGGGGSLNDRLPSIRNPPESPSSYDDEFNSGTLDAKWTETNSGLASLGNDTVRSIVLSAAPLTASIRDLNNSWPSWLLYQLERVAGGNVALTQNWTATTDATFSVGTMTAWRPVATTADDGSIKLRLSNSGDANEWVEAMMGTLAANGEKILRLKVNNNGAITTTTVGSSFGPFSSWMLNLSKRGNDYHAFTLNGDGTGASVRTSQGTKTGVTTFDRIQIIFDTDNVLEDRILGVDFFRVYENSGTTFAFMHP